MIASATAAAAPTRFELSFPASVQATPVDGRVFVVVTRDGKTEPRLQFGKSGGQYRSVPFFGADVTALSPGQTAVIDERTEGYPLDHLSDLPAGEYFVQAVLNVYTTFHRADGHDVKLHMDQWEGQDFPRSPGNLYSEPKKMSLSANAGTVRLSLDRKIPPIEVPADTEYVKHVRFDSPLLSKFWGRPIPIGATILLPRDYDRETFAYPVLYEQGHFSTSPPGGFGEHPELPPGATERQKERAKQREDFTEAWKADDFPRMLLVTFQHPTPYYDDSYAIDTPNMGPYGKALTEELIPYIESHFRVIREPWARILSGGSTGGWESLALQVFYPDFFGGTFTYCPDPVDFHYFEMVNIYEWDSAWEKRDARGWLSVPIPGERAADGQVLSLMKQQLKYERVMGGHGRSGEDWDCWQAVYGPMGADGYFQPLFDPATGAIDHKVAAYWKEHTDLNAYLQRRWKEIGPALVGKIHIWTGDMDTYYLNDAVYLLEDFLKTTTTPFWGGSITYGPRQPHCWTGNLTLADRLRGMAVYAAGRAPRGLDRPWWRG